MSANHLLNDHVAFGRFAPLQGCCITYPMFTLADICRRQQFLSKHTKRARGRRMVVADLYNACSDFLTVKERRSTVGEMSATNAADVFVVSATFLGNCEQAVRRLLCGARLG